ncbi:MAG: TonB-dependent receptor [Acidobacteria bacterium]|nr:TonB-dependent receptor [Acidobacteriota bacterium]
MAAIPVFSQQDRATISGTVTDPSGAAVPGVQIVVRNTATNATYELVANAAGIYTLPNLPVGPYKLQFAANGFRTLVRDGMVLSVAQVAVIDVRLQLGSVSESVEVTAETPALQTSSPEVGALLDQKHVTDLPLSFSGSRSPESFAYSLVPGVQGNSWESRINGSPSFLKEVLLDGASVSTYLAGDFSQSKPSPEAVEEFRVQTSGLSAEYSGTGGGVFNFVMKSGTNQFHGSSLALFRNESMDANSFANNFYGRPRQRDRRNDWAVSGGGPVIIPKVYNGRDKTFFYVTYEKYSETNLGLGNPSRTVPLPDFWKGDFRRLLTNEVVGTDALGRNIIRGSIYDPATTRTVDGKMVRDTFPGNIIPASMISPVSAKLGEIMNKYYPPQVKQADGQYALVRNSFSPAFNQAFQYNHQFSVKVDENVSSRHKFAGVYSYVQRPRLLADNNGNGLWTDLAPNGGPLSSSENNPFTSNMGRLSYDFMASARMLNHLLLSVNRSASHHIGAHIDEGGAGMLGIQGVQQDGPWPVVLLGGNDRVNFSSIGYGAQSLQFGTSYGISDTLTYLVGRHSLKFGFEMRRNNFNTFKNETPAGTFNFSADVTGLLSNSYVGNSMASMLLGLVTSANGLQGTPTGAQFKSMGAFVNDTFKVNNRLTLTLGMRWDYQPVMTEMHDRLYTFCTTCVDPYSNQPGALEYAGTGEGRNGKRGFVDNSYKGFGPRIGFAYQASPKLVFRGGYGIFFPPRAANDWAGVPYGSLMGFAITNRVSSPGKTRAAFNWNNGYPGVERPVGLDPSMADWSWGPVYWDPNGGKLPYTQQWNANVQFQLPNRLVADLGYIGSKSTALLANQLSQINQLSPKVLVLGSDLQDIWVNSNADIPLAAKALGARYPFAEGTETISLQQTLQPYPQLPDWQSVLAYNAPLGFATYHSMQVSLTKNYSHGLTWLANYTFSKTITNMDTALYTWVNAGRPADYYNLSLEKSIASYDQTHVVKAALSYELPFGKGKRFGANLPRALDFLAGGWVIQYIGNYANGMPLSFPGRDTTNYNAAANRAVMMNPSGASLSAGFDSARFDMGSISTPGSQSNRYVNTSLMRDPKQFERGNASYSTAQIRGFGQLNEDIGIQKNVRIFERFRFQLRAELLDALNRHRLSGIDTSPSSPLFGQVVGVDPNQFRTVQVGMRLDW